MSVANDLRLIASSLETIARDLDRVPTEKISADGFRHVVDRIDNSMQLLNQTKSAVDDLYRALDLLDSVAAKKEK